MIVDLESFSNSVSNNSCFVKIDPVVLEMEGCQSPFLLKIFKFGSSHNPAQIDLKFEI